MKKRTIAMAVLVVLTLGLGGLMKTASVSASPTPAYCSRYCAELGLGEGTCRENCEADEIDVGDTTESLLQECPLGEICESIHRTCCCRHRDPGQPYNVAANGGTNQVLQLCDAGGCDNHRQHRLRSDGEWRGWHGVRGQATVKLWEELPSGEWKLVASCKLHRVSDFEVSPQSQDCDWPFPAD